MRSSISLGGINLWVGSKQERNPSEDSEHAGNAKRGQKKPRTSQSEIRDLSGVQPMGSGDEINIRYKREP